MCEFGDGDSAGIKEFVVTFADGINELKVDAKMTKIIIKNQLKLSNLTLSKSSNSTAHVAIK